MKIITWNCNMAFRKKAKYILQYQPDILIVPECEQIEKLKFSQDTILPNDIFWLGKNPNKGLGVFSYSDYKIRLLEVYNPAFEIVLPLVFSNEAQEIIVFAIWAGNPKESDFQYVEHIWHAIHHYQALLNSEKVILVGDFNSNTFWDKKRREGKGNHTDVVAFLGKRQIYSTYHYYFGEQQGKETKPTLFMYRNETKPYHIDYCFVSNTLLENLKCVEVGKYKDWVTFSDHAPLIVEFKKML